MCSVTQSCLFVTPWTVACQAPLSMGFPRQEYYSGLPLPIPRYLSYSGIKLPSPALAGRFFTTEPPGKSHIKIQPHLFPFGHDYQSISSVAQSCLTLCNPMDCSLPGFPIHQQLPELTQSHVH